jgi:hypothetical protein
VYGKNAFAAASTTPSLNLKIEIAGLSNAKPGDKPTILRFNEGGNNGFISHATGLLNCGQPNNGASDAIIAVALGCPVAGSPACPTTNNFFDFCAPLAINHRGSTCTPAGSQIPPATTASLRTAANPTVPVDCIDTLGGGKSPVPQGVACRIFTSIDLTSCANAGNPKDQTCSANNWSPTLGAASIPAADPRAVVMVITAPEDLSKNNGPPVPIRNFAVFYIVGWSLSGGAPGCKDYGPKAPGAAMDAYVYNQCTDGTAPVGGCTTTGPPKNRNGGEAGEIWGYWIKYTDPGGIPSQTVCDVQAFGNCVPALTR